MASPDILRELANQATECGINLDDSVETTSFQGCNALVYQGTLRDGVRVAVKTVLSGRLGDAKTIEKILQEAHSWSKIKHENIFPLMGITTKFDSIVSIVSKWITMGNAHDYVQDPAIDPRPLIADIACGMDYLHAYTPSPIIHGNLKGSNVLISDEGRALIADIGYASLMNSSSNIVSYPGDAPNWMPPGVVNNISPGCEYLMTKEGDIRAYGMTCLELFTRKVPSFDSKSTKQPDRPNDDTTHSRMSDEWWNICCSCWTQGPSFSWSEVLGKIEQNKVDFDLCRSNALSQLDKATADSAQDKAIADSAQDKAVADSAQSLTQMSERATHFSINLSDQVDQNMNIPPRHDNGAIVFRGTLRSDGTKLTVKTARAYLPAGRKQTIEEAVQEMHVWSELRHENIIPLLGIITSTLDHTVTLVSKWTESKNALEYVQDDGIDPCPLLLGIAEGLNYLHNYKPGPLCHGDLRGLNVMVSEDGQALLTFGITPLLHALFQPGANLESLGRAPNWVSPEELESGVFEKTPEADIWAFGMVALELFARKPPFDGLESVADIKSRILQGPPDRPSDEETCDRLTPGWWDLCSQCWQRKPSSRVGIQTIISEINKLTSKPEDNAIEEMSTPEPPDNAVEELATTDVIVAIMGPTGAGKSSFISQFIGNAHGVGHGLTSCTSDIKATKCLIGPYSVVLVDTPGFDDTNKPDLQILDMVSDWLEKTYEKKVLLSSILFFHRITDNRMAGTPLKNLRVFQKLCGKKAMGRVVLVTTMWDEIDESVGRERLKELKRSYWKAMIKRGSKTFEHKNDRASAEKLLETIAQDKRQRESVALQTEIADLRMALRETGAGQELCSSLEQLAERRLEVLQKIRAEKEAATNEESARDLRKEYEDLRTQLDATLSQVQNLKLSLRQRAIARLVKFKVWKGSAQSSLTAEPSVVAKTTSETPRVPNEPPPSRPGTPSNWWRVQRPSRKGGGLSR